MAGRLDRYVSRTVIGSYAAALLFMAILFTLVNLLVELGGFLVAAEKHGVGGLELMVRLARYYALFLPVVFVMVAPFVSVIAGMFAVSRHMAANEVVPMLFTGRSIRRVLWPVLGMGVVSAAAMVLCWELVVPRIAEPIQAAKNVLDGDPEVPVLENLIVKLRDGVDQTLFVASYDHHEETMTGVSVVDRGSGPEDVMLTTARTAKWDESIHDWRLVEGRRSAGSLEAPRDLLGMPGVEPDLLWRLGKEGREMVQLSYTELLDLQALRPGRRDLVLAFHSHITFPLANIVLLLLALPFAVHFERGSRVERVLFAVLLCGGYLVTDLTCHNLGKSLLHPVLAAWLPTILFGSVGVAFSSGIRT